MVLPPRRQGSVIDTLPGARPTWTPGRGEHPRTAFDVNLRLDYLLAEHPGRA